MSAANVKLARMALEQLTAKERMALIREMSGQPAPKEPERILRRAQIAERFSVTKRCVDNWISAGILEKCVLPGRHRGAGVLESQIEALMQGKSNGGAAAAQ